MDKGLLRGIAAASLLFSACVSHQRPEIDTSPKRPEIDTSAKPPSEGESTWTVIEKAGRASAPPPLPAENAVRAEFTGTSRKAAKTSIVPSANAPLEEFTTLDALLESLPSDADMAELNISRDADSDRVDEELRNVTVEAYLYAAKLEDDKDFHLILGTSPKLADRFFMNCEVSGLPEEGSPDRAQLQKVREQLLEVLGRLPGERYVKLTKPIQVRVEGSLFFDVEHPPGAVGPATMRPETAWEIHPISSIQRAP
jgi:hypothetical protein